MSYLPQPATQIFALACSYALLWACTPAQPLAIPSAVSESSPPPSVTPTPETSSSPDSPVSEVNPSASPEVPAATPSPEISESAGPSASANEGQQDISVVEKTTFNGKVFDDTHAPLDGVKVSVKSLSNEISYSSETLSVGGTYAFNNAPAGIQLEIRAEKTGYTTRRRVEVLKSNKEGDPNANRYDFGTDGASTAFGVLYNALSDQPEVIQISPGRNAAAIAPSTSFTLTFSEPMDRKTVEDNFELRAYTDEKLTVDTGSAAVTLAGSQQINSVAGTRVWDKSAFAINWNRDDTAVTFSFLSDKKLPTDKDSDKVPDYQISLERQDKNIKDKSGITRSSQYFKLTEGNFERSAKFSVDRDETAPGVLDLTAFTAENSGTGSNGDAIKLRFSEPMVYYTLGPTIAGGMGGNISQAAAANNAVSGPEAAQNYTLTVNRNGTLIYNQALWSTLGGRVVFDSNDPTHRTVLLLPPTLEDQSLVNSRPEALDGMTLRATFEDGSSQAVSTGTFQTSGPGLTNAFEAQYAVAGTGASRAIEVIFAYTDGTSETVNTSVLDAAPSAADLKGLLDNLTNASPWSITDLNGGDILAGDTVNIHLAQGSTRLSTVPVHGNKPIAWVRFANTAGTAFANDALGQAGTAQTVIVPVNGDAGVVEAALNQSLDGQGTSQKFTLTENTATAGLFEAGDRLTLAIHGNPTLAGKSPKRFHISQSGMFEAADLNAPTNGLSLFVGAGTGQAVDLYRPGDNVFIQVNTTLVDPAGNSLDSSRESANANAS